LPIAISPLLLNTVQNVLRCVKIGPEWTLIGGLAQFQTTANNSSSGTAADRPYNNLARHFGGGEGPCATH
jgi:hypothetical protein